MTTTIDHVGSIRATLLCQLLAIDAATLYMVLTLLNGETPPQGEERRG